MTESLQCFISYKREDQPFAERLWQKLGEWGFHRWLDVKDIDAGISPESSTWYQAIDKGLRSSQALIAIITPQSLKSQNVIDEWFWAKQNNRRIFFLRLKPFDPEQMSHQFLGVNYIDLVDQQEEGLNKLQAELERYSRERNEFEDEIKPEETTPAPAKLSTPDYLKDDFSARSRYIPWRLTLRVISGISLPVAFLWLLTNPDFEPLLASLGATGTLLGSFVGEQKPEEGLSKRSKLSEHKQMRRRVYQYWVQGVKETALKDVEEMDIALGVQPDAVVRHRDLGDFNLPNDSRHVRQVYDKFNSFLILGDPGAGKTIMLLQLAENLIIQPPPTVTNAIPLVLNLSSWSLDPKPLEDWLEDETWRTYRVKGKARDWLENNQLILLLDGLDEVKEEVRHRCVEAINTFHDSYNYVPLVVCSRIKDYENLPAQLNLPGAILLEDLTDEQIDRYLSQPDVAHIKRVVESDATLRTMASTPFLLNTMVYAYRHEDEDAIRGAEFESAARRREHLFDTYVRRRLSDNPSPWGYQRTIQYLEWLATKMQAYVQTVFRLEDIQPDWLEDDKTYKRLDEVYKRLIESKLLKYTSTGIFTILYAAIGWLMGGLPGLLGWAMAGFGVGYVITFIGRFKIRSRDDEIWWHLKNNSTVQVLAGLYITVSLMAVIVPALLPENIPVEAGLVGIGLAGSLIFLLWLIRDDEINTSIATGMGVIALPGLAAFFWSIANIIELSLGIETGIIALLSLTIVLQILGFDKAESSKLPPIREQIIPFLIALLTGVSAGMVSGWLVSPVFGFVTGMAILLTYGGLLNSHFLLERLLIWMRLIQTDTLPSRPEGLLHVMTDRQILRRMGGGYIFIHRYLLENFARRDEIAILFDRLLIEEKRDETIDALRRIGQPALRPLRELADWRNESTSGIQRHYAIPLLREQGVEFEDNRPGVGLLENGLPDIRWGKPVPAGTYTIGGDSDAYSPLDEQQVSFNYSYKLARYPVTYAQFQVFAEADDYLADEWWQDLAANRGHKQVREQDNKYANHPRENVNWYQAVAFTHWLTAKYRETGLLPDDHEIRLPTEQEWEAAARYSDGRRFPYGDEPDTSAMNVDDTGIGQTSAVGLFPSGQNPALELFDLSGNVWEWCLNEYDNPDNTEVGGTSSRVLRGGSFFDLVDLARAASRGDGDPGNIYGYRDGFRVVSAPVAAI